MHSCQYGFEFLGPALELLRLIEPVFVEKWNELIVHDRLDPGLIEIAVSRTSQVAVTYREALAKR